MKLFRQLRCYIITVNSTVIFMLNNINSKDFFKSKRLSNYV